MKTEKAILRLLEDNPASKYWIMEALKGGYQQEELVPYLQRGLQKSIEFWSEQETKGSRLERYFIKQGSFVEKKRRLLRILNEQGFGEFYINISLVRGERKRENKK